MLKGKSAILLWLLLCTQLPALISLEKIEKLQLGVVCLSDPNIFLLVIEGLVQVAL